MNLDEMEFPTELDTRIASHSLELLKVQMPFVFSRLSLARAEGGFVGTEFSNMVYKLQSYVLADKLAEKPYDVTFTYQEYLSWWQHLKAQYQDKWWMRRFARRWPPKSVQHGVRKQLVFERLAIYPHAPAIAMPDEFGRAVIHERITER